MKNFNLNVIVYIADTKQESRLKKLNSDCDQRFFILCC